MLSQQDAPLVDALRYCAMRPNTAFYTPGHKRGQGSSDVLVSVLGKSVLRADLPELPELDNLFAPESVIAQAQDLAAQTFGSDKTYFLANGSTCGVEAAILATCRPGDKILVPRNLHRSVISGLILAGANPIYLSLPYSDRWSMAWGAESEAVSTALANHPDIQAVLIVSPTYQGICSPIKTIAEVVHGYHIPLIVDEAHGPHFAFHSELPISALESGADIVVQSTHKVLSALTQAAMLHIQGDYVDAARISQALQLTQSTSPSYLLLASLDAARHQMANQGEALMTQTLDLANEACDLLASQSGLTLLSQTEVPSYCQLDLTRITVGFPDLAISGFDADDWLHTQCHVTAELPSLLSLTFIVSLGNTPDDIQHLVQSLTRLVQASSTLPHHPLIDSSFQKTVLPQISQPCLSPREAFFATKDICSVADAIGQISADTICAYPPGIPTLLPGEIITASAIAELKAILKAGGVLTGGQDSSLETLRIVRIQN